MNEFRETAKEVSTTPSGTVGLGGCTQKQPYAPPRVERLIDTSRGTLRGGKQYLSIESLPSSAGPS